MKGWTDGRSDGQTDRKRGRLTDRPPAKDREGKRYREAETAKDKKRGKAIESERFLHPGTSCR